MAMGKPFVVSTPRQLAAIASPGREDIVDAVSLIGPCGAAELARFLGRSRHSLYYHLKALSGCRLLIETRRPRKGARDTAFYEVPGGLIAVRFDLSTPTRKAAVTRLVRRRLDNARKTFERACRAGDVRIDGPNRNLWATHLKGWLSDADLVRANALFAELIALVGKGRRECAGNKRAYAFTFALSPIAPFKPAKNPRRN